MVIIEVVVVVVVMKWWSLIAYSLTSIWNRPALTIKGYRCCVKRLFVALRALDKRLYVEPERCPRLIRGV